MESRACGGCGTGGFVTLTTTNETGERLDRLAYLQTIKDIPPHPTDPSLTGSLTLEFYELWNDSVWRELLGDRPTIEGLQTLAQEGKLRLSKVIKSPSGVTRARIYATETAVWEPIGDEECDQFPGLHKSFIVKGYPSTTVG